MAKSDTALDWVYLYSVFQILCRACRPPVEVFFCQDAEPCFVCFQSVRMSTLLLPINHPSDFVSLNPSSPSIHIAHLYRFN